MTVRKGSKSLSQFVEKERERIIHRLAAQMEPLCWKALGELEDLRLRIQENHSVEERICSLRERLNEMSARVRRLTVELNKKCTD